MKYFLSFSIFVLCTIKAVAQPGTLDKSFADSGTQVPMNYIGECNDLLTQPDGKILVIGDGSFNNSGGNLLVRYNIDGTPDLSFGDSGRVVTNLALGASSTVFGALQPDGKIVQTGITKSTHAQGNDLVVLRYNAAGSADQTFGHNGMVQTKFAKYPGPSGIFVEANGKILVGGSTTDPEENGDFNTIFLIQYNADGSLDEGFGNGGIFNQIVMHPISVKGFALQPDGKILIGGTYTTATHFPFFVRRYVATGMPDSSFGTNGEASYSFTIENLGTSLKTIALQNEKIIAAGIVYQANLISDGVLIRFNADGTVDQSFANSGLALTAVDKNAYQIYNIITQSNGNITSVGNIRASTETTVSFAVSNYLPNGNLDSSFGTNGIEITKLGYSSSATAIALEPDGKIVAGGYALIDNSVYMHVALARYNGLGPEKNKYVRIKRWLHHNGFTWEDKPGNDISYYSIQRSSSNGFTEIARVLNHGNNQQSFEDASAATGSYSYRVAAVTESGNITYSNIITIESNTANIKVYPNPVKNSLQIEGLPANAKTKLTVTDLTGTARIVTTVNSSTYSLNVAQLTKGNYMIKIESGSVVVMKQFIKE